MIERRLRSDFNLPFSRLELSYLKVVYMVGHKVSIRGDDVCSLCVLTSTLIKNLTRHLVMHLDIEASDYEKACCCKTAALLQLINARNDTSSFYRDLPLGK